MDWKNQEGSQEAGEKRLRLGSKQTMDTQEGWVGRGESESLCVLTTV